jgi:hypothetical protein
VRENSRLISVPLLAAAFVACENPLEPPEEPDESGPLAASVASDVHATLLLSFDSTLVGADGKRPTQASGVTFRRGISGSGVLVDGCSLQRGGTVHVPAVRSSPESG